MENDHLSLPLGYSEVYDRETTKDLAVLEYFFGRFTTLQLHVEMLSMEIRRVTAHGVDQSKPLPRIIDEQFAGPSEWVHHTKNGSLLRIYFGELADTILFRGELEQQEETVPTLVAAE